MGLLDSLFSGSGNGGGLLDSLLYPMGRQPSSMLYPPQAPIASANQPSPLDTAQWPQGPIGAPRPDPMAGSHPIIGSLGSSIPVPTFGQPDPTAIPSNAQPAQAQMLPQASQPPTQQPPATPTQDDPGMGDRLMAGLTNFGTGGKTGGLIGAIAGGIQGLSGQPVSPLNNPAIRMKYQAFVGAGMKPSQAMLAAIDPESAKILGAQQFGPDKNQFKTIKNADGSETPITYNANDGTYKPIADLPGGGAKLPNSALEYQYYLSNLPKGQQPMDYATFATARSRAGATNVVTNIDPNSGQTYDKQLAEGLGKAHAGLANGVEDAQGRARDLAAMQGAIDSIQARGGTTGGLGQQQIQDLKKTINAGASALGLDKTFDEADISDKEFLTKFNRTLAGQQAKNAVGSRVTNFEMQNYLKANPGLDMSPTGNQRLIGIQSQIEQRNIAVGNAIRDATAKAIASGQKIDPVTVQKIITDYDGSHHIQDPITGQDLTQSYALPEFHQPSDANTNSSLNDVHSQNVRTMERTIGGIRYYQKPDQPGKWFHD